MLSEPVRLILAILSAYRLAELISVDDGPFKVFDRLRRWAGRNSTKSQFHNTFADLLHCPFCTGVWFSFAVALLVFLPSVPGDFVLLVFGIAGAQAFLESLSIRTK